MSSFYSIPGPAGTIQVGTVTKLAPAGTPTVTNVGTAQAAILNFGIPQGDAGLVSAANQGTAAAPGIAFAADTNTGFYNPSADVLGISTNGVGRLTIDATTQPAKELLDAVYFPIVTQADIGGGANQLSLNGMLGGMAFQNPEGVTVDRAVVAGPPGGATAESPLLTVTGAWFSGGTATTTKPELLIEPAGTTSTNWSTSGTGVGVNAASGFAGNLLDLQVAASRKFIVDSAGRAGIGVGISTTACLSLSSGNSDGAYAQGVYVAGSYPSTSVAATPYLSVVGTQAGSSVATLQHFSAQQTTINGTVTNQYGFHATSSIIGATNNYGFFSNIPSGTGRWNFYANGTADSYFASNNFIWANGGSEKARIDSSGRLLVGATAIPAGNFGGFGNNFIQVLNSSSIASYAALSTTNDTFGSNLFLGKARSTSAGIVQSGDTVGQIVFAAADGVDHASTAGLISCRIDGTPGADDTPGRLVFSTTADGASTPTERMRIDSSGRVGIGTTNPTVLLDCQGTGTQAIRSRTNDTSGTAVAMLRAEYAGGGGGNNSNVELRSGDAYSYLLSTTSTPLLLGTASTERARIDASGRLLVGTSSARSNFYNSTGSAQFQLEGVGSAASTASIICNSTNTAALPALTIGKSSGAAVGSNTLLADGSGLGALQFQGNDGTEFVLGAQILCELDGTPGANDMPSRLVFSTTADGTANPAERMRIDSAGRVGIGTTAVIATRLSATSITPIFQVKEGGQGSVLLFNGVGGPSPATIYTVKSRGTSYGTIVQSGDGLMRISAAGDDGVQATEAARIEAFVDGTPGANDMPGRLVFSTTADGASTPTERMRINSTGNIGINWGGNTTHLLSVAGTSAGGSGILSAPAVAPGATAPAYYVAQASTPSNAGTPYTHNTIYYYEAKQGVFHADSTVSNQYGFIAGNTLTGATNNYGFFSSIASGTGRWNFYANGTADNYFAGNVLYGSNSLTSITTGAVNGKAIEGSSILRSSRVTTTAASHAAFYNPNGLVGQISTTDSTTSFVTTSDYRLKENVTTVSDGITRLQQLKPSRFNFIANPDKTVDGFLAHEVQTVVPEAITGEKDAVDDNGNPIYQGIDQSKLVPLLTAALQEAVAEITALKARLDAAGI